ncbi:DMT family transporter [Xenophilus arseniciresistens]|uniref:DMT family transporter n=1 Tax=Xenophilus arseniciresistens TaxID=1283306 RepID=A0AAE3SYZ3_9BURK|nr:DMT family transporter [Xenophilus arseniciresistens]MDA7416015.1 DMT family transporter [Xenophilus arseniciresistens]
MTTGERPQGAPASPPALVPVQVLLLGTTAMWGLNVAMMKWLTGHFDPIAMAVLRMVAATLALSWLMHRAGRGWQLQGWRTHWKTLLVCSALMIYLNQWLFAAGLQRSSATNGALITGLSPLVASVLAWALLRERLPLLRLIGVMLGLSGVAVVVLQRSGGSVSAGSVGDLLILCAIVLFGLGSVLLQRLLQHSDALAISLGIHALGSVLLLAHSGVAALVRGGWPQTSSAPLYWAMALLSGALATGLGNLMWTRAISRIGMARAALWTNFVPLFAVAAAALLLGERITRWDLLGLLLVLAGTRLGMKKPAHR